MLLLLALERGALGKHVALAPVRLALDLGAPEARPAHVRAATRTLQAQRPSGGRAEMRAGLGLLPNGLRGAMLRAAAPDSFNLSISSIPGPRTGLDMLGARLDEVYPVVPIAEDQALSSGMLRYHRHLHFGLYADPVALPGAARLPDLLAEQVRALGEARPAERAHRPVVALRARPAPTPS